MTFDMDSFVSTGKHAAAVIPMLVGLVCFRPWVER